MRFFISAFVNKGDSFSSVFCTGWWRGKRLIGSEISAVIFLLLYDRKERVVQVILTNNKEGFLLKNNEMLYLYQLNID